MSVLTTLALVAATAAAKIRLADPADKKRIAELEGELAGLKIDLADARRDLDAARREAEFHRAEADMWAQRAYQALHSLPYQAALQPAGPDFRPPDTALRQTQAAQLAQYQQMAAMQAQNLNRQALGAQNFFSQEYCNCVPARHDMFLRGHGA